MNAVKFLLKEHEQVRKMFSDISDSSHKSATKRRLFEKLCETLLEHEKMEETVWYPYLQKKHSTLKSTIDHLIAEEKSAEKSMEKALGTTDDGKWEEKFQSLKKDVLHHAEEEEIKLFPKVTERLDEKELEEIGRKMHQFKNEYSPAD